MIDKKVNQFKINNIRNQEIPRIAGLINGSFVITWVKHNDDPGIYGQKLSVNSL